MTSYTGGSQGITGKDCTLDGGSESGREHPQSISPAMNSKLDLILIVSSAHQPRPARGVPRSESEGRGGVALTALFKQNQLR